MRDFLAQLLSREDSHAVERAVEARIEQAVKKAIREYKKSHTVSDMVRENLRSFNPRALVRTRVENQDIRLNRHILDVYDSEEEENVFLSGVHELAKDATLRSIVDYLLGEQIMYTAMDSRSPDDVFLAQHNMNGIMLVMETVHALNELWKERHEREPEEDEDDYQ